MTGFPHPRPPGAPPPGAPPPGAGRNLLALLCSPFGRIGRVTFVLLTPLAIMAALALFFIGIFMGEHRMNFGDWQFIAPPVLVLFGVVLICVGGSLMPRRLHDIGVLRRRRA